LAKICAVGGFSVTLPPAFVFTVRSFGLISNTWLITQCGSEKVAILYKAEFYQKCFIYYNFFAGSK